MDAKQIKLILDYNDSYLSNFVESQRDIYVKIKSKLELFFKKRGLNIILITGLRGTGKTTILKTIAKNYSSIYTSGDLLKTNNITIRDITQLVKAENKKIVIIDEITYLSDWGINLKIESDANQDVLYVISGSSAMQLKDISQDLARRLDIYKIYPLSFKEFLRIKYNLNIGDYPLSNIIFSDLSNEKIFLELNKIKYNLPKNLSSLFKEYYILQFPYLLEELDPEHKLVQMVEKIVYKDLPQIDNFYTEHLKSADLILKFLTTNEKTNFLNISRNLNLNKDIVAKIVNLIENSDLITLVPDVVSTRELRNNKKILFSAPSIRLALNPSKNSRIVGFAREDMFGFIIKKLNYDIRYNYAQNGYDYSVLNKKFEIGALKKNIYPGTIVVGDFLDLNYKKQTNILYLPFYIFALMN